MAEIKRTEYTWTPLLSFAAQKCVNSLRVGFMSGKLLPSKQDRGSEGL